jgi:hypothetical protein
MKYTNQDIINYYTENNIYSLDKIPEIIRLDDFEMEVINYLLHQECNDFTSALVRLELEHVDHPENTEAYIKTQYKDIDQELLNNFIE